MIASTLCWWLVFFLVAFLVLLARTSAKVARIDAELVETRRVFEVWRHETRTTGEELRHHLRGHVEPTTWAGEPMVIELRPGEIWDSGDNKIRIVGKDPELPGPWGQIIAQMEALNLDPKQSWLIKSSAEFNSDLCGTEIEIRLIAPAKRGGPGGR